MTPTETLELENCLRRVSEILYHNSSKENYQSFADLEIKVRDQIREYVSPQIALFLSRRKRT